MPPIRLTSTSNPRVKAVLALRESRDRRRTGLFIAEGVREVTRAHAAGLAIREVFVCPELLGDIRLELDAPRTDVSPDVFRKMAYVREPGGVLAVVEQPNWTLDHLPRAADDTLVLVAVGTEKPGNLGAMVRTADAAGCAAVIAAGAPVDAFNPNAIRSSTAAVFTMPIIVLDEPAALDAIRHRGYRIAAATLAEPNISHTAADLTGPLAIAIGPEDTGLSAAWIDAADLRVRIPMQSRTADSLNASNAAAILLFEALRQRTRTV